MDHLKILPAAAVIIAMTAAIYFVRDQRDNDEVDYVRARIVERSSESRLSEDAWPAAIDSETGRVYLVEIRRDNRTQKVMVDAQTGKIVGSIPRTGVKA